MISVLVHTVNVYDRNPASNVIVKGEKKLVLKKVFSTVYTKAKAYMTKYGYLDKAKTEKLTAEFKKKLTESMKSHLDQENIVFEELRFGMEYVSKETMLLLDGFSAVAIELSACKTITV